MAKSAAATPPPRKKLCVTIDEADNFGLELVKATRYPLIGASEVDSTWQGKAKCSTWPGQHPESVLSVERHVASAPDEFSCPHGYSSRPSSMLYSESLGFDFDEVIAHY